MTPFWLHNHTARHEQSADAEGIYVASPLIVHIAAHLAILVMTTAGLCSLLAERDLKAAFTAALIHQRAVLSMLLILALAGLYGASKVHGAARAALQQLSVSILTLQIVFLFWMAALEVLPR